MLQIGTSADDHVPGPTVFEHTGMKRRLEDSDSVILSQTHHISQLNPSRMSAKPGIEAKNSIPLLPKLFSFAPGGSRTTHLQHVQQSSLASVIETEEEELCVLVQQAEVGEDIVDYSITSNVSFLISSRV